MLSFAGQLVSIGLKNRIERFQIAGQLPVPEWRDGVEPDTIIYRRQITPWKYTPQLHAEYPNKDWILTRIMWLCGQEPGLNQGGDVDSYDRAIYLHGSGSHVAFGTPTSRGCVRMRNEDIIELYSLTTTGLDVLINEHR